MKKLFLTLLLAAPALGQTPVAPPSEAAVPAASRERPAVEGALTLQEATQFALQNSPITRGGVAELDIAQARIRSAQAARKLGVSATTFLTTGDENGPIYNSPMGVTPQNLFTVPSGGFADQNVMFMLPLLTGGRLQALTRQAQLARDASAFDLAGLRLDVTLETRRAYLAVLLALETQNVAGAREKATLETLENDRAALRVGRVPQLYVLRDEAEYADAQQSATDSARDVEIALISLRAVMGAGADSSFTLKDALAAPPAPAAVAQTVALALAQRPEILGARKRLESSRQGEVAAKGTSKLQASLMGMGDLSRSRRSSASGVSVGLILGIPLFDGGLRRADREVASGETARAQAGLERLEITVESEVESAQVTLQAALKNIGTAQSALEAAQESYRVALLRYQSGRSTNAEALDSLAALTRARTNVARARYQAQIAADQLARASGSL